MSEREEGGEDVGSRVLVVGRWSSEDAEDEDGCCEVELGMSLLELCCEVELCVVGGAGIRGNSKQAEGPAAAGSHAPLTYSALTNEVSYVVSRVGTLPGGK